jgi:hypothetical protein
MAMRVCLRCAESRYGNLLSVADARGEVDGNRVAIARDSSGSMNRVVGTCPGG